MDASWNFGEGSSSGNSRRVDEQTSQSTRVDGVSGSRKRVHSSLDIVFQTPKKPRLSGMGSFTSIGDRSMSFTQPLSLYDRELANLSMHRSMSFIGTPHHARAISHSSYTPSLPGSPRINPSAEDRFIRPSLGLYRSASMSSLYSPVETPVRYSEFSAKHFLNHARMTIDYSLPDASSEVKARLLTCSPTSVVYFTRGNRVHHKNISTNSDVSQLCKYSEKLGNIRVLESGGISQANTLAIGSSKGYIHLWDVNARKVTVSWCATKEITALAWNGPILSVGGIKGSIRHYDTRLPATKMREQAHLARHRGRVTCLKWNEDGRFLASGDVSGKVHCWELGQNVPLNVGETVTRRKQIQHDGKITAIAWAPWEPKLFATGDDKGIMRLWLSNDKNPGSNAVSPGKVEIGAAITGIHFSPQCQEILTTHAEKIPEPPTEGYGPRKPQVENSITIHMHPSMRHGLTYHLPGEQTAPIGDSVLDGTGTKLVVAVPSTNKIEVCTAWAKRKELKKQQSFTDRQYSRIR